MRLVESVIREKETSAHKKDFTDDEKKRVEKRLRELGYIIGDDDKCEKES